MRSEVATLKATDRLDLASDIMTLGRIRHLPVVDGHRLVGIVSQRDLFRAAISSVLQFRPAAERSWLGKIAVMEVMTRDVHSAGPTWPLRQAVTLMNEKRVGCLPVTEGDRLVGLLSESDCLEYLGRLLDDGGASARDPQ